MRCGFVINIILDLFVVAIIVISIVIGAKRGFFKAVLRTFAGLITIVIAYFATKPLSKIINDRFIYNNLEEKISSEVNSHLANAGVDLSPSELVEAVPDSFETIASLAGYDIEELAVAASEKGHNIITTFVENSTSVISSVISTLIAFVVLLIGVYVLLRMLASLLDLIFSSIPVLKKINRTLGMIFGFVCSLINSWIFVIVSYSIINLVRATSPEFLSDFSCDATYVYRFFAIFNPLC